MRQPYLVQRGKFKNSPKIEGVDSLIDFDYMGSAEFEYGALPKALKEICAVLPELTFNKTDIKAGDKHLWFLCKEEDVSELIDFWNKAIKDRFAVKTKELLWYGKDHTNDGIGTDEFNF